MITTIFIPAFGTQTHHYQPWVDASPVYLDGYTADTNLVPLGSVPLDDIVAQVVGICEQQHTPYTLRAHSTGAAVAVRALCRLATDKQPAHVVLYDPILQVPRYPRLMGFVPLPTWLLRWSPVSIPKTHLFRRGEYSSQYAVAPHTLYETWHGLCTSPSRQAMQSIRAPVLVSTSQVDPLSNYDQLATPPRVVYSKLHSHHTYKTQSVILAIQKWVDDIKK